MPTIYTTLDIYLIRADVNKTERMLVGPIVLVGPLIRESQPDPDGPPARLAVSLSKSEERIPSPL